MMINNVTAGSPLKFKMYMGKFFNRTPSSVLSLDKTKRDMALGLKRSPLLRWLYDNRDVNQLLLVPRDLRTADPSLSIELDMGQFGLAGATILLEGRSPYFVEPPNISWAKELHSFSWLRNLRAARTDRSHAQALDLTEQWLNHFTAQKGLAWEAEVAARRLICWLSHSNFILSNADETSYLQIMNCIDDHMRYISKTGVHASMGKPRLLSLIALVFARLCVANQEKHIDQQVRSLCAELDRQILPDGGHISRDNSVLASFLLDLLPLKQCFLTRNFDPPDPLVNAINRMLPMINYMRLGDGLMSRFNGSGTTLPDTLSTAMAYDDVSNKPLEQAPDSHYYRLQKGNVVVLMDGGRASTFELSQRAHAGCLSFEMSSGTCPVIVNCGAAPPAYPTMSQNARASVSHSTLTINNRSSAQFIHDDTLKNTQTPSLVSGPPHVTAHYETKGDQSKIIGSHDGYLDQFGLVHHRLLSLSNDGYKLNGEDWIELPSGHDTIQRGLGWPYAVHFHIHPDVQPLRARDGQSITLKLPDSQIWTLSASGNVIHLEESTFYADFAGPCRSIQAVIRNNCVGPVSISWQLSKSIASQTPDKSKIPTWLRDNVVPLESAQDDQTDEDQQNQASKSAEITDLVEDDQPESDKKRSLKPRRGQPKIKGDKARTETQDNQRGRAKKHPLKEDDKAKNKAKKSNKTKPGLTSLPTLDATTPAPPPLPKGMTPNSNDHQHEEKGSKNLSARAKDMKGAQETPKTHDKSKRHKPKHDDKQKHNDKQKPEGKSKTPWNNSETPSEDKPTEDKSSKDKSSVDKSFEDKSFEDKSGDKT